MTKTKLGPSDVLIKELIKRKIPTTELERYQKLKKQSYGLPKLGRKLK